MYALGTELPLRARKCSICERLALHRAGIGDDDGQEVARLLWSRLPAEGKPKTIEEWVGGLRAEGAVVPKPLAAYLTTAQPATKATPKPAPATGQAPSAAGSLTPDAISQAYADAARNPHDAAAKARLAEIRQMLAVRT